MTTTNTDTKFLAISAREGAGTLFKSIRIREGSPAFKGAWHGPWRLQQLGGDLVFVSATHMVPLSNVDHAEILYPVKEDETKEDVSSSET